MVRNIVGSLVYVGKGKYPSSWMAEVLAGRKRENAAPTFSPAGLYLAGIGYDAKWKIPKFVESPLVAILPKSNRTVTAWPPDPARPGTGIE
jgi:tRNA pseudouridine38-40 synthase